MIKSRKGQSGVEGGKGICYQWKEKGQWLQGDRYSFRHETNDRAQKPEHTAATLSEPTASRGRSVSRKRGKSNHGSILRQPCRYYLKVPARDRLVNIGIRPSAWHPPECQFFKNKTGCKAGDKRLFPHYKVPKNMFQLKEKDKATFHSPSEEWVLPAASTKELEEKSLWWIPELVCIWSARETSTLLSWRPCGNRGVRRR